MKTLTLLILPLALASCSNPEPPPEPVPFSPGPPRKWDIGDETIRRPLPDDMADGYLEFAKSPGFGFGITLAHERLSARSHERHDMVLYVHRGSARFHIGEKDFYGSTGDALYILRGAVYSAESTSSQPLQLFTVYAPPFDPADMVYHEAADRVGKSKVLESGK